MPHQRYLIRHNAETTIPEWHVAVDTETLANMTVDPTGAEVHRLHLGCAALWQRETDQHTRVYEKTFTRSDQFWDWLAAIRPHKRKLWLWSSNLTFDLAVLDFWELVKSGRWQKRYWCFGPKPTILDGTLNGLPMVMCDLRNWLDQPLAETGEWLGLPKLPMPAATDPTSEWEAYCQRDAAIVREAAMALCNFVESEDLGNFKPTLAGQSMQLYRHKFLEHPVEIHDHPSARRLERAAYIGGQIMAPHIGAYDEPVTVLDVHSLYPAVQRDYSYPCRLRDWSNTVTINDLRHASNSAGVIARVQVNSPMEVWPERMGEASAWHTGRFWTALTGPELCRALDSGHICAVSEIATYDMAPIFSKWAAWILAKRQNAEQAGKAKTAMLWKRLANSLHGKFGASPGRWVSDPEMDAPEPFCRWRHWLEDMDGPVYYRAIAGETERLSQAEQAGNTFAAIAAYVTAHARERMLTFRNVAGGDGWVYQYVDALHVTYEGLERLQLAGMVKHDTPGLLRVARELWHAHYFGPTLYTADGKVVSCGLPATAVSIGDGVYRWKQFESGSDLIGRAPDGSVRARRRDVFLDGSAVGRAGMLSLSE